MNLFKQKMGMLWDDKDWSYPPKDALWIIRKLLHICAWNLYQWICKKFFITYDLIGDCARCFDCGRNVHDWHAPDWLWMEVIGHDWGVWCYDCFCDRADRKLGMKFRNYKLCYISESVRAELEIWMKETDDGEIEFEFIETDCDYIIKLGRRELEKICSNRNQTRGKEK